MVDRKIGDTRGLASGDERGMGLRADWKLSLERKRHICERWMWTQIRVEMEGRREFEGDMKQKVRPDEEEGRAGVERGALD